MKRYLWNYEFARGRWTCLESTVDDGMLTCLKKYARNGSILDLGCGPGTIGNDLDTRAYGNYTGVDISDVAVEKAAHKAKANGRREKNGYYQSDIVSYVPEHAYDVLLFSDSLYYVPRQRIAPLLARYSEYVKEGGVFIARMFDVSGKHQSIIDIIEQNFDLVEKHVYQAQACVIVFQPRPARQHIAEAGT